NVDMVRARLREYGDIISAAPVVTPNGAVAFRFEVSAALSDELVEPWEADGLHCVPLVPTEAAVVPNADTADRSGGILSSGHYLRVDLARLDELMRMIGNLVILRSRLTDTLARSERHLPASQ